MLAQAAGGNVGCVPPAVNPWTAGVRCLCPASGARTASSSRRLHICTAKDGGPTDAGKADFSAYWSLKFREFFSKRREYLQQAAKRKEPPEVLKQLDAQIAFLQERLEEQQILDRRWSDQQAAQYTAQLDGVLQQLEQLQAEGAQPSSAAVAAKVQEAEELLSKAGLGRSLAEPTPQELLQNDVQGALGQLQRTRTKALTLTPLQLRAAANALVMLPLTLPATAYGAWKEAFASQRYENFLMAEGERVWYWRNRTENERWFWEEFFMQRMLVPAAWTVCYLAVVPNNLIWAVLVPFVLITWQNGAPPHPGNMEWWLIMVLGLYGKCWDQVLQLLSMALGWA